MAATLLMWLSNLDLTGAVAHGVARSKMGRVWLTDGQRELRDFALRLIGLLAVEFALLDLAPGFNGPYERAFAWATDHPQLAPWFSGTATSIGVVVALLNAQFKERSDDRRAEAAAKRTALATAEAACGIANTLHLNISIVSSALLKGDWHTQLNSIGNILVPALDVSGEAMKRFPIHSLPMRSFESWYRIDLFRSYLVGNLRDLVDHHPHDPDDGDLLMLKRRAMSSIATIAAALKRLSRGLSVEVDWEYGNNIEPFDIKEQVEAEIAKINEALAAAIQEPVD